ncbi:MAG: single-stranded DNA-binding protein [Methylobacter sp.]
MNKLIISGRLTRDAEVRYLPSGKPVMQFSVANNTGYGEKQQTHYFDCSLFGDRAEGKLKDYMLKGTQVLVEGEVSLNTYQKQDGSTGAGLRVFVRDVELIGGQRSESSQSSSQAPVQPQAKPRDNFSEAYDDDIPFASLNWQIRAHLI